LGFGGADFSTIAEEKQKYENLKNEERGIYDGGISVLSDFAVDPGDYLRLPD
jgi:hypothetical protein